MYLLRKTNCGFTLVEVLVSISLLLVVLAGPLSYLAGSSQSAQVANEQIPAIFLAQEGVEIVHKVRDDELVEWYRNSSTGIADTPWNDMKTFLAPCFSSYGCGLELDVGAVVRNESIPTCVGDNCRLYLYTGDEHAGISRYSYNEDADFIETPYTRVVYMEEVIPDREIEITSEVTWRSGSLIQEQRVEVKTSIFNVYDTN